MSKLVLGIDVSKTKLSLALPKNSRFFNRFKSRLEREFFEME